MEANTRNRLTEAEKMADKSWIFGHQNRNFKTSFCISGFEGRVEKQSNEKLPNKGDSLPRTSKDFFFFFFSNRNLGTIKKTNPLIKSGITR